MALDGRELIEHNGLFGISREDWDAVKSDISPRDIEKRFMDVPEDAILIYQLKETAPDVLFFRSFDGIEKIFLLKTMTRSIHSLSMTTVPRAKYWSRLMSSLMFRDPLISQVTVCL